MNKKASITELLVMLVLVVLTSAVILYLVHSGIISVKADAEQTPLLNAEFIPVGREGYLALKDFQFCDLVDPGFNCVNPTDTFFIGSQIHFLFHVESSTYNGEIMILENYRITSPSGKLLLDAEEKNNFHFDVTSKEKKEIATFKDYFTVTEGNEEGTYTLDLILENPLLNKKTTIRKTFTIQNQIAGSLEGE